jgi:branched-chain amino acid transport system ATP-binding protein
MLDVQKLSCGYGSVTVVHGLDLQVQPGKVTALLGPNGAGKTSVIMAIAGHIQVKGGSITFDGESLLGLSPADRTRRGIAIVPEGRRIFPDLTVAENLLVGGYIRSRSEASANQDHVMTLFPRLKERHRQRAGTLSGGEQQMLAIGRALMASPRLIMIDELSLGLMPSMVDLCMRAIQSLVEQGIGVLLVEQNTHRAVAVADTVTVLASGNMVFTGASETVRGDPTFADRYLGVGEH